MAKLVRQQEKSGFQVADYVCRQVKDVHQPGVDIHQLAKHVPLLEKYLSNLANYVLQREKYVRKPAEYVLKKNKYDFQPV